jgi:PhnB protein
MKTNPYLNFNGDCKEAMEFYAKVLGGEIIHMQSHANSPMADPSCAEQGDKIIHARLAFGDSILMASDSPPEYYSKPQGIFVSLHVDTVAEAERVYAGLSEGGSIMMPLGETFWAVRFAMFTDRFGTPWMINCEKSAA